MESEQSIHVVFCGQIRTKELFLGVLDPFLDLYQKGLISTLILSTWKGEVEKHPGLALVLAKWGVEVIESVLPEQLKVQGHVFEQVFTLDRALDELDDNDLVLRTRCDVLFEDKAALAGLLEKDLPRIDPDLPPVFRRKVWVSGFFPTIPFFMRDHVFYGLVSDLRKLGGYDLLVEAYDIRARPHEFSPHHSSGAAPEVRRFMAPFLPHFPSVREYQFIWPKHCIGTKKFPSLVEFNCQNELYREHVALYLYLVHHYFLVGDIPAANGRVALLGYSDEGVLQAREGIVLSEEQWSHQIEMAGPRTQIAEYMIHLDEFPCMAVDAHWIQKLMEDPQAPGAQELFFQPLKRVLDYRHGPDRNRVLRLYLRQLYQLADAA